MGPNIGNNGIQSLYPVGHPLIDDWGYNMGNLNSLGVPEDFTPNVNGTWSYSPAGGLANPNALYLNTGVVPSSAFASGTNMHFSLYIITANNQDVWSIGATDASGGLTWGLVGPGYSGIGDRLDLIGAGVNAADSAPGNHGYYIGTHVGTDALLYKNGSLFSSNGVASSAVSTINVPITIFALNCPPCGGIGQTTTKTFGSYTIGTGFLPADIAVMQGVTSYVMTTLGRP